MLIRGELGTTDRASVASDGDANRRLRRGLALYRLRAIPERRLVL